MQNHCAVNLQLSAPESWDVSATDGSCECSKWLGRLLYGASGQWIKFLTAVDNRGAIRDRTGTKLSSDIIIDITKNFHKVFTMDNIFHKNMSALALAMEPVIFTLYSNYNLNLYDDGILINQCSVYTIDDLIGNPMLRRWCGCMLNPTSYESRYTGVSIACTPVCNSSEVMQYGVPCQGTACILDDITISLIDSKVGAVSLVQICQSCGQIYSSDTQHVKQTCDCTIGGNIDINAVSSIIGNISLKEVCGLDGNGGKPQPKNQEPTSRRVLHSLGTVSQSFPYTVMALLITVIVMAITAYIISRGNKKDSSYLWAIGLLVTSLIVAVIIIAFILYTVIIMSLPS